MMETIRNLSGNIIFKALFGLLIIGFISWGASDVLTGNTAKDVAIEVGDIEITPYQVRQEFENQFERLNQAFGGQMTREQARAFGLINQSVNSLIDRSLISLASKDLGIMIGDGLVAETIQNDPGFKDALGKFDRNVFNMTLAQSGLSEARYVSFVKQDLSRSLMLRPLIDGARPSDLLVDNLLAIRGEKRTIDYVVIERAGLANIPIPHEEELEKYYKEHPQSFTAPEFRKVSYLSLKADDLVSEITITEEAVKTAFDERQDEFVQAEKRKIKQIVLTDEAKAREALEKIKAGGDFAAVAKDVAGMDEAAIDLGELTINDVFLPELGNAAFALADGAVSDLVKSSLGWHILKVDGITPGKTPNFDEVKDYIQEDLAKEKAIDALFELANKVEDSLSGGATLEEAANEIGVKVQTIDALDASGNGPDEKPVKTPAPRFSAVAFDTEEGEQSQLTEAGEDGYFLLRVDSITPPALKKFDDIVADVIVAWKADAEKKAMEKMAADLVEQAKKRPDFAQALVDSGINTKIYQSKPFTRDGVGGPKGFPADFVKTIFAAKKGEAVSGHIDDASFVARVKEIIPVDKAASGEMVENLKTQLTQDMQSDLSEQLTNALRNAYPVTINQRALQDLN